MGRTPTLFMLCLAIALPGCSAPPSSHNDFAPLLGLVEERLDIANAIARHKWEQGIPVQATEREQHVLARARAAAPDYNLDPQRAEAFFSDQIEASKLIQYALIDRWTALGQPPDTATRDLAAVLRPRLDKLQDHLLLELGKLDLLAPTQCSGRLTSALTRRTNDPLRHLALVRATGQLCQSRDR